MRVLRLYSSCFESCLQEDAPKENWRCASRRFHGVWDEELLLLEMPLSYVVWNDVGDLMQAVLPGCFDRILCAIESSALFVWFMRWRFRGLKARRWVEGWIRGHYPDEDVQILNCEVRTGRAQIYVDGGRVIM